LLLYQYGGVLNYLHCRFISIGNTGVAQCDCEKQLSDSPDNSQSTPLQKTMAKEKVTDDLFVLAAQTKLISYPVQPALSGLSNTTSSLSPGFCKTIYQPPKA